MAFLTKSLRVTPIRAPHRRFWSGASSSEHADASELTAVEARRLTKKNLSVLSASEMKFYQKCMADIKRNAAKGIYHIYYYTSVDDIVMEKLRRDGFNVFMTNRYIEISWRNIAEKELQEFNELIELEGNIDRISI